MEKREFDLAVALQLQRVEQELALLKQDLTSNTKATEDLLKAWNTSRGTLSFIKSLSIWVAALAGGAYSINKLWN
jgi:hypothetical protein